MNGSGDLPPLLSHCPEESSCQATPILAVGKTMLMVLTILKILFWISSSCVSSREVVILGMQTLKTSREVVAGT